MDLVIECWDENISWANSQSWCLKNFMNAISECTDLRGAELKRVARGVKKKEILVLSAVERDNARQLTHILESLGATISFKN